MNDYTICVNCKKKINTKDLKEGEIFKCSSCYHTLIVDDKLYKLKEKLVNSRNRWIMIGMILGLIPMIPLIYYMSVKPILLSVIHTFIISLIILSMVYFKNRFSDIIIGIMFSLVGVYTNIAQYTLSNYAKIEYLEKISNLRFQTNFFLIFGIILIILGLFRRRNYKVI